MQSHVCICEEFMESGEPIGEGQSQEGKLEPD